MLLSRLFWLYAAAQVPAAEDVQWSALPECPDRGALLTAITRRLGRPLDEGEVKVDARVEREPGGFVLRLELAVGARGETREVHDPSCAALTEAAAVRVVAAIAAGPVVPAPVETAGAGEPLTEPPAEPIVKPAAAPLIALTPKPMPSPEPELKDMSRRPGLLMRAQGGAALGAVPGPTGTVGLVLALLWPRVRVELRGTLLFAQTAVAPDAKVRAGLYTGAVLGCGRVGRRLAVRGGRAGTFELPLCAGLEVGAMRAEARNIPQPRTASSLWVAAVVSPGMSWHANARLSVWTSLDLVLAIRRPEFKQGDGAEAVRLFLPSVASGRLLLGVELRFGDRW